VWIDPKEDNPMKNILKRIVGFLLGRKPDPVESAARTRVRAINDTREQIRLNNELTKEQGGHQHGPKETSR
jgi:hypothetical protein